MLCSAHIWFAVSGLFCSVLYATFAYPCMEVPTKREPDYVLPYCYYMNPPALKTSHFSKFQLETLFYIFYNMPKVMSPAPHGQANSWLPASLPCRRRVVVRPKESVSIRFPFFVVAIHLYFFYFFLHGLRTHYKCTLPRSCTTGIGSITRT